MKTLRNLAILIAIIFTSVIPAPVFASTNTFSADFVQASAQYAQVASGLGLDGTSTVTIEAWINTAHTPSLEELLVNRLSLFTGDVDYNMFYDELGGGPEITCNRNMRFVGNTNAVYTVTLSLNTWYHVVCQYDGISVNLFTAPVGGTHTLRDSVIGAGIGAGGGSDIFTVAADDGGGTNWDGKIDEVRVWSSVRTIVELDNNFQTELVGNEAGLVAYYQFNNNWNDTTASAYNLTAYNTPTFSTDVPFAGGGAATVFNGGDDDYWSWFMGTF